MSYDDFLSDLVSLELLKHKQKNLEWYFKCWYSTRNVNFTNMYTRRQDTVAQYIAMQPILDLCEQSTQRLGVRVSRRWWEQEGIDLEMEKERAAESTTTDLESEAESEAESEEGWGEISASSGVSGSSG